MGLRPVRQRLATGQLDVTSIRSLYGSEDFAAAAKDDKLLTAVVGFGEKTDFLLDPPAGDAAKVKEALDAIKSEPGSREETFAALKSPWKSTCRCGPRNAARS